MSYLSLLATTVTAVTVGAVSLAALFRITNPAHAGGLVAAGFIVTGLLLIPLLPRWQWWVGGLLLMGVTWLALGGFWFSWGAWGISDWDYYFSSHETIRRTILTYHTLPRWNPYTCGGTAALADPEFSLFTPTFALELLLGIPRGLRAAIYLATLAGAGGMLLLGKRLGLSVYGALLAALVVSFGSVNLLEVVEGHPIIFAAGWIPWIFLSWLNAYGASTKFEVPNAKRASKSRISKLFRFRILSFGFIWDLVLGAWDLTISPVNVRSRKWVIICSMFLALTFYQGGIYLLMYTGLAFLLLPWLTSRPRIAGSVTMLAGLWAIGLAALKLVPVLLWLGQFQDETYASSSFTLPYLHHIFFGRYLHDAEVFAYQNSGWHEYGAYIGALTGILALVGLRGLRRQRVRRALAIAAISAIALSSAGPLLVPLFDHADWLPRSNISRFILLAVIPLALLAGAGLDHLRSATLRLRTMISVVAIGLLAADLLTLAYALSLQAFVLPPVVPPPSPASPPLAFTAATYQYQAGDDTYTRAYAATLAGYGTLSYCSPLHPPPSVRTIHDEVDNAYLSFSSPPALARVTSWSPNEVAVEVAALTATQVVINTNFSPGWLVNGERAQPIVGRVGSTVGPGSHRLLFTYAAPGLKPGLLITILTGSGALAWLLWRKNFI